MKVKFFLSTFILIGVTLSSLAQGSMEGYCMSCLDNHRPVLINESLVDDVWAVGFAGGKTINKTISDSEGEIRLIVGEYFVGVYKEVVDDSGNLKISEVEIHKDSRGKWFVEKGVGLKMRSDLKRVWSIIS